MNIDPRERATLACFDARGVRYERFEHAPALTMEDCEALDASIGAQHFKNLFLTNRQGTEFYLLLIGADKLFKTADVSKQLGVARLSFATDAQLMEKLGLLPGSVTPLALAHPGARDVRVVIDREVLAMGVVCVHPCVSTASLVLAWEDVFDFILSCGNPVTFVEIAPRAVI